MFPGSYVPRVPCSPGPMFPGSYVGRWGGGVDHIVTNIAVDVGICWHIVANIAIDVGIYWHMLEYSYTSNIKFKHQVQRLWHLVI